MNIGSLLLLVFLVLLPGPGASLATAAEGKVLHVLSLEHDPPAAFRDSSGKLTGFNVEIARAVCREMNAHCVFYVGTLDQVQEKLATGKADFAAVGLLESEVRRQQILFARPHYRSFSVWLARPGVVPGSSGVRVGVVRASAQASYAARQGWRVRELASYPELTESMAGGGIEAALLPMVSSLHLQMHPAVRERRLAATPIRGPGLEGAAAFGIAPHRQDLKPGMDAAIDRLKRNGTFDRINSRFLPFRVS